MAKALTINYGGKKYIAEFDRASAKAYAMSGNKISDVWENPLVAVIPFVHCAFKKHQPTISVKKAEEVYDALSMRVRPSFLQALVAGYIETIQGLVGDEEAADGDEGNAVWENEDED